jgi:hypothetical protein
MWVTNNFVQLILSRTSIKNELFIGQGLHIVEASRSQTDTSHSVGLLWKSDRPEAETST